MKKTQQNLLERWIPLIVASLFLIAISFKFYLFFLIKLPFVDSFGVITGIIAISITIFQMYRGFVDSEAKSLENQIENTAKLLLDQINESNDLCKERFETQQNLINYVIEKLNNLTIDIKSHEKLPSHNGSSMQISTLQKEVAEIRAGMSIINYKTEILNRLNNLESAISLNIEQKEENSLNF